MIDFVTLENVTCFSGNPLTAQHRLRYQSIIQRQNWDVPSYALMEFDQYDNPAAKYLVYRDENNIARGVSRFYPTITYMLEQLFSRFVTNRPVPKSATVWEGSRFCIDDALPSDKRKRIAREIVVGYLETALRYEIEAIVGLMYPAYWRSLFTGAGWEIEYMGDIAELEDGNRARAAWLPVSPSILANVRKVTGIHETIVNFGEPPDAAILAA